jgi:adenylate cyclase
MQEFRTDTDFIELHAWLIEAGLSGITPEALFDGFCRRLIEGGLPIARGFLSIAGLHPLHRALSFTWQDGRIVEVNRFEHVAMETPLWRASPFRHMLETRTRRLHRRLIGERAELDFPVLQEFRAAGLSEWLALMHGFGWADGAGETGQFGIVLSWAASPACGRAEGWSPGELAALEALSGTLALAVKGSSGSTALRDVLCAYLGDDAASRVIDGEIRRGTIGRLDAGILYADLRGFTSFTEETPSEEVIRRLNGVFDCLGEPVKSAGGEILKFLGDGALAVFLSPEGVEASTVAAAALGAAEEALARLAALNAEEWALSHPPLMLDIALHAGEVAYGNIGTPERLDFTVIGPAVNEATRLEGLCKELGRQILISETFAAALTPPLRARLRSLGRRYLRGVKEPREIFTTG